MAYGRQSAEWKRTAAIVAKIHNVNAAKKSDLLRTEDIDPMHEDPESDPIMIDLPKVGIEALKVFVKGKA